MSDNEFSATVYKIATGEIVTSTDHSSDPAFQETILNNILTYWGAEEHGIVTTAGQPATHYVVTLDELPTVVPRPDLVVNIDRTEVGAGEFVTLTGMPNPCRVIIDAVDPTVETQTYDIEGGGFEFEPETPGLYTIEVHRFPFLAWKVEIVAN